MICQLLQPDLADSCLLLASHLDLLRPTGAGSAVKQSPKVFHRRCFT